MTTKTETKATNTDRINELVRAIHIVESEIKRLEKVSELENHRNELKVLMVETNQNLVVVDGIEASVIECKGKLKVDEEKARKLLHQNTFRAIFTEGKPYPRLVVKEAK